MESFKKYVTPEGEEVRRGVTIKVWQGEGVRNMWRYAVVKKF